MDDDNHWKMANNVDDQPFDVFRYFLPVTKCRKMSKNVDHPAFDIFRYFLQGHSRFLKKSSKNYPFQAN